ncbi:hypothetical protein QBC44DRAFT_138858 [Cladorrhinum sp. PSN332]|nr:hypothetical protein QBC44DRAFT_138858 [Cladorrhinum sp. PSN332]
MSAAQNPLPSIQVTARGCRQGFGRLLSESSGVYQGSNLTHLQDEYGRFNLWVSSTAVFAPLQVCLDFRLKDLPEATRLIVKHLNIISTRLEQLFESSKDHETAEMLNQENSKSALPTSGQAKWDFTSILRSIHEAIDWLHRLSNAVRKAGFSIQNQKATQFIIKGEDGNDITEILGDLFYGLVKRESKGIEDWFARRLAHTMLLRRRRILYRRFRQRRWTLQQASGDKVIQPNVPTPGESQPVHHVSHTDPTEEPSQQQGEPLAATPPYITPSTLTATVLEQGTSIKLPDPSLSRISRATTAPFQPNERLLVPPYPRAADDADEFVCGYCCLVLSSAIAANSDRWANHVKRDLDPYLCIYDPCPDPFEVYTTSAEWLAHMRTQHRTRWHCPSGEHSDLVVMDSRDQFVDHMEACHPKRYRTDQLASIAETSTHSLEPTITSCPFCTEPVDETEASSTKRLQAHVSKHLQYFALLSLPPLDGPADDLSGPSTLESSNKSGDSQQARSTLLDPVENGVIPEEWLPPRSGDLPSDSIATFSPPSPLADAVVWELGNTQRRFPETDETLEHFSAARSRKGKAPEQPRLSFQALVRLMVGTNRLKRLAQERIADRPRVHANRDSTGPSSIYESSVHWNFLSFEGAVFAILAIVRLKRLLVMPLHMRYADHEYWIDEDNIRQSRSPSPVPSFGVPSPLKRTDTSLAMTLKKTGSAVRAAIRFRNSAKRQDQHGGKGNPMQNSDEFAHSLISNQEAPEPIIESDGLTPPTRMTVD